MKSMKRKNGKFVGKHYIPFTNDQLGDIQEMKCKIQEILKDKEACVLMIENEKPITGSGFVRTKLTINLKSNGKVIKDCVTKDTRKTVYEKPSIVIILRNRLGVIDGTDTKDEQMDVWVYVVGIRERGYRKKSWSMYEPKGLSFGFGYTVDVLWEDTIKPAIEKILADCGGVLM